MIQQLQAYYGKHLAIEKVPKQTTDMVWFYTDDNRYVGIKKDVLSSKDIELLSIFLKPYHMHDHNLSPELAFWHHLLFQNQSEVLHNQTYSYIQFLHFSFAKPIQEKQEFEEALKGVCYTDAIVVWENDTDGVLVEKVQNLSTQMKNLDDVVDVLTVDFGSSVQFFEGQAHRLPASPGEQFYLEKEWFHLCKKFFQTKKIIRASEALIFLLLHHAPNTLKRELERSLDGIEEGELLQTVKAYLECNLNMSLTSKKLYMHRNSLQYRIDKFVEKTGIDIKNFQGAVIAYLSILALEAD